MDLRENGRDRRSSGAGGRRFDDLAIWTEVTINGDLAFRGSPNGGKRFHASAVKLYGRSAVEFKVRSALDQEVDIKV